MKSTKSSRNASTQPGKGRARVKHDKGVMGEQECMCSRQVRASVDDGCSLRRHQPTGCLACGRKCVRAGVRGQRSLPQLASASSGSSLWHHYLD